MTGRHLARELRRSPPLDDPMTLCAALGLGVEPCDRQRQGAGLIVRCPRHGGVSCSVTRGPDGTVRVRCFGCGFTGDALDLVAAVRGLDRRRFREVLREAAGLAGCSAYMFNEPRPLSRPASQPRLPAGPATDPTYPPLDEVTRLWSACGRCEEDVEARELLSRRGLAAELADLFDLARAIPQELPLPSWARFRGATWTETGHRLLVPVFDARGAMRSVRAWCVRPGAELPKRLPPAGHRAAGLVLADGIAVAMLAGHEAPKRVVVVEGEPDFVTWATRFSDADEAPPAVLGLVSGAWSDELAARIPNGARVAVRTDHDATGGRYARAVRDTLAGRCEVLRARAAAP